MHRLVVNLFIALCLFAFTIPCRAATLTVTKAGPVGEVANLAEANEIRVVFSEPMIALGKASNPAIPFFKISPDIKGSFRWAGTTTLIFTPDSKKPLPYATRFEVIIDGSARAVSGNTLDRPYVFSFTTPTVKLLSADWYRKGRKFDAPIVVALRFNQPVRSEDIVGHVKLQYVVHDWQRPQISKENRSLLQKIDPASLGKFDAKVARTAATASATGPVFAFPAQEWDKERFPASADLVVLESKPGIPTDAWIRVSLDDKVPARQGKVTPGARQEIVLRLEPTFFITGFSCSKACNPEQYNALQFTTSVKVDEARSKISVADVTAPSAPRPLKQGARTTEGDYEYDESSGVTLEDLGYEAEAAHTYEARADASLKSSDGQTLGYDWAGRLENWHKSAFTSFGDGHGVWESSGGPQLPFYARNMKNVTQWLAPLDEKDLVPTILKLQEKGFQLTPDATPETRTLAPVADKIQSYGLNISKFLSAKNTALLWAAVKDGQTIPRSSRAYDYTEPRASVIQVTNLGISVKDSPLNTLIFVTRLDTAQPVEGARVAIRSLDNAVFWSGVTGQNGIAIAPNTVLRLREAEKEANESKSERNIGELIEPETEEDEEEDLWFNWWGFKFLVTAEKDGDLAYVGSDWTEGLESWSFGLEYDLSEARSLLRGEVFTDRGVYKLGEELHLKAILRSDTPQGMRLLAAGSTVTLDLRDSQGRRIQRRTLKLNEWSSAEAAMRIPLEGALGNYQLSARVEGQRGRIFGEFLVAAYRRPDFRVDVKVSGDDAVAGANLQGVVTGRYLFGAGMSERKLRWTYWKTPIFSPPAIFEQKFPNQRYVFVGRDWLSEQSDDREQILTKEQLLDSKGLRTLTLPTQRDAAIPYEYTLEGEVADISRQRIANRNSFRVHPAPWYIGVKTPPYFAAVKEGIQTEIIAATPEGQIAPGVPVKVQLTQVQWHSVRRAEGSGMYAWETERKDVPAGDWEITTTDRPVPLSIPVKNGGYYVLTATARDKEGRSTRTITSFYAVGAGYTAWERYDHNRIELVPEKKTYKPGETARIMIQSPWERATALMTVEREGVRTHKQFALTSTQETITVPIGEDDIPNIFVSVLLVKGRTEAAQDEDNSDPGKPAFRLGYTELRVEDASRRLGVRVKGNQEEYRPGTQATVSVEVDDWRKQPSQAEVTLWAVDYGVLSLTNYKTPDVLDSIYIAKALQVMNEDSRQRIISRRVLTPKGADDGGGGGRDPGANVLRKDFRVLAFWLGSVVTDSRGRATTKLRLPESLTTYRIMAVAGDKRSRFGWGESEIRINKPVLLRQAFPRFLALGDKALFGSVVNSQLKEKGSATVTMRSLDPDIVEIGGAEQKVDIAANGSAEVRFPAVAKGVGEARIQTSVRLRGEGDAYEEVLSVRVLASPETVAVYGQTDGEAKEAFQLPADLVPGFGGLSVEMASTAMVGLSEGARYLVEYPYGCAEQRASRGLGLMLVADLGESFQLPGIRPGKIKETAQSNLRELDRFQCPSGGFAFWIGECSSASPYLTSYVLHVMQRGKHLGYAFNEEGMQKAYAYLEQHLSEAVPENEGWRPAYTAWQAFAIKVLTEGKRNQDSNISRLYGYLDRMPVFALSFLHDALTASGEKGKRVAEVKRRIDNAVLPESGSAHVEELADPYLLYFWNSNVRSTAIVLGTLVRNTDDRSSIQQMVRWLMNAREKGRWGNTQENAWAMESLVDYYRKYEKETPDFSSAITLGAQTIATGQFKGRSTEAQSEKIDMKDLLRVRPASEKTDLLFSRQGTGTLFYMARLRYALNTLLLQRLDQGFTVERSYASQEGSNSPSKQFKAGQLIRVTLRITAPKERRFVAVTDPVPAGLEPVESLFATTASDTPGDQRGREEGDWTSWWRRGGFDRVERHDDRVNLFATRLSEGTHEFSYVARATTSGTFHSAPTYVEQMYEPEVFARTATDVINVD